MKKLSIVVMVGLTTFNLNALAVESQAIELDTLIIYSQGAIDISNGDVETKINHLMTTTNKIYTDSGLNVKLNPVKIQQYSIDDTASSQTILIKLQSDKNVINIRNSVGADNVVIYRPYANDGVCGLAYQNNELSDTSSISVEEYAFAHISIDCGSYVTAHEIGHNTGLGHSVAQKTIGAYPYARGHGVENTFTTVMAYSSVYGGAKIYKYSSPILDCKGLPCGIDAGELNEADAVKALAQTLPLVANFREHIVIDNNNSDDENGTETLDDTFKAFKKQQKILTGNRENLKLLRELVNQKREAYIVTRTSYAQQRKEYNILREEYKSLKAKYRESLVNYRTAKIDYQAKRATKKELLSFEKLKDELNKSYKLYYNDILLPSKEAYNTYMNSRVNKAKKVYNDSKIEVRSFYKEVYKPSKIKLRVLKKEYLILKKISK